MCSKIVTVENKGIVSLSFQTDQNTEQYYHPPHLTHHLWEASLSFRSTIVNKSELLDIWTKNKWVKHTTQ